MNTNTGYHFGACVLREQERLSTWGSLPALGGWDTPHNETKETPRKGYETQGTNLGPVNCTSRNFGKWGPLPGPGA